MADAALMFQRMPAGPSDALSEFLNRSRIWRELKRFLQVQEGVSNAEIIVLRINAETSPLRDGDEVCRGVHATHAVSKTREIK